MQLENKHILNEHLREKQKEKQTHKPDGKGAVADAPLSKAAYMHCEAYLQMWLNQAQPEPAL